MLFVSSRRNPVWKAKFLFPKIDGLAGIWQNSIFKRKLDSGYVAVVEACRMLVLRFSCYDQSYSHTINSILLMHKSVKENVKICIKL